MPGRMHFSGFDSIFFFSLLKSSYLVLRVFSDRNDILQRFIDLTIGFEEGGKDGALILARG